MYIVITELPGRPAFADGTTLSKYNFTYHLPTKEAKLILVN